MDVDVDVDVPRTVMIWVTSGHVNVAPHHHIFLSKKTKKHQRPVFV